MKSVIEHLAIVLIAVAGCMPPPGAYSPPRDPDSVTSALASLTASLDLPRAASPSAVTYHRYIAGQSLLGRPLEYYTFGSGPDRVLVIAAIHGSEPAGIPLAYSLGDALLADPALLAGHSVLIIPLANPDGLAANTRHNANDVDLNRNFISDGPCDPNTSGQPFSEPESQFIDRVLREFFPDRIVTIHQPLSCIDYDGPAQNLAEHMARFCPLPINKLGARPCSLGSYAGELLNIPIITLELTAEDSQLSAPQLWQKYAPCLLSAITYPNPPPVFAIGN